MLILSWTEQNLFINWKDAVLPNKVDSWVIGVYTNFLTLDQKERAWEETLREHFKHNQVRVCSDGQIGAPGQTDFGDSFFLWLYRFNLRVLLYGLDSLRLPEVSKGNTNNNVYIWPLTDVSIPLKYTKITKYLCFVVFPALFSTFKEDKAVIEGWWRLKIILAIFIFRASRVAVTGRSGTFSGRLWWILHCMSEPAANESRCLRILF